MPNGNFIPGHPAPPLRVAKSTAGSQQLEPYFSLETLIALLDQNFPDRAPTLRLTDREIVFQAGQVSVVRFLKAELAKRESEYQHPF
jgi:hypothetical protein